MRAVANAATTALEHGCAAIDEQRRTHDAAERAALQARLDRLIHSVRKTNAKANQALATLLSDPAVQQADNVRDALAAHISRHPAESADTVLKVSKGLTLTLAQFRSWDYVWKARPEATADRDLHPVHKIVVMTMHALYHAFIDRHVRLRVGTYWEKCSIHFDTFSAGLTLLLENAAKYAAPESEVSISFKEDGTDVLLVIDMVGLCVDSDELEQLRTEGFRGREAIKSQAPGQGLGMDAMHRLFEAGGVRCSWEFGDEAFRREGLRYGHHRFVLRVPRAE